MAVPMADGGSQEFVQNGYAVGGGILFFIPSFPGVSNELSTPAVLTCPTDTRLPPRRILASSKTAT